MRNSRQVHQNLLGPPCSSSPGAASSLHSTQGSLQSHSASVSDAQSSTPSKLSQETILSGSIFCPSLDSQESQPSGIGLAHSQTRLSQETAISRNYSSQSNSLPESQNIRPSQASEGAALSIKSFQIQGAREIQETPLFTRFVHYDPSVRNLPSYTGTQVTPISSNSTTDRLLGKFAHRVRGLVDMANALYSY